MQAPQKRKRRIAVIAVVILAFHFGMSFMYTAPPQMVGDKSWQSAAFYVSPIAHQYWRLFAPEVPKDNHRLVFWYKTSDGEWSVQQDPYQQYFGVHRNLRITWHGKMCLAIYNLGFLLEQRYRMEDTDPEWRSTKEWKDAVFFMRTYAELHHDVEIVALRSQLEVEYVEDGEIITIDLPTWKAEK